MCIRDSFMEEAERCDRVGILHEGKLVAFDKPTRLKSSIGGDVEVSACPEPDSMAAQIRKNFSVDATVVNGSLRIETPGGHRFVSQVVKTFRAEITSVTWGQPTLD